MKNLVIALFTLSLAAPALAQTSDQTPPAQTVAQDSRITCFYNDDGKFTDSQTAPADARPLQKVLTHLDGDHAWTYTIHSTDGKGCPRRLPD
jgi:hypothetical protein